MACRKEPLIDSTSLGRSFPSLRQPYVSSRGSVTGEHRRQMQGDGKHELAENGSPTGLKNFKRGVAETPRFSFSATVQKATYVITAMKTMKEVQFGVKLRLVACLSTWLFWSIMGHAATLHNSTGANVNIPDSPAAGANSSLTLSGAPGGATITKVKVYYEIRHPYIGDLEVYLTSYYDGSWHDLLLRNRVGGSADDAVETKDNLAFWNGASPNQTWYLTVKDKGAGDVGYIDFFEIWVDYSTPGSPNLTPYQPSGWSDEIVVSRATGNNTDSASLTTADTLYLDWAVINNGNAAAGTLFYTELYVDGVLKFTWNTTPPLGTSVYTSVADYSIGSLSAGTHTLRIKTDSTGVIGESNEGDNEYTKTISVATVSQPNLTPYQPSGWSDKIVVSRATGNNTDSTSLTTADTLYLDWAVINNGNAAAGSLFYTELYVDGVLKFTWNTTPPLGTSVYTSVTDYSIGSLTAGTHTLRIKTDSTSAIGESNEGENEYTKTISVAGAAQLNLTPYRPSGWSDKIVVSRTAGNNADSTSLTTGDSLYVDWAVINSGNAAVGSTFYTALYVDGVLKNSWFTSPPLNANYYTSLYDYNIGALSAGAHTISITTDSTGVIGESSEADNTYTKTISVAGTSLPDFLVTSVSLNPSSPQPGQAFTASVTVKNQGSGSGDGKWLDVWAHQPSSQSSGADGDRWTSVGTLTSGQSKTFTFSLTAGSAGSQIFRAFVDSASQTTESNEANNQTTFSYTVVQPAQSPDFIVTSITLSPTSPQAGQAFTANVTVKNQGAGSGDGKWLDVWANQSSAPPAGTDGNTWASVGTLSAGQSKTFTLTLTAPTSAGACTFRAFVDSYSQTTESNEANNQTTLSYNVGAVAQPPDFVVTTITFNPAQPVGGQPFTAYVTVKNQGAGSGDGKYLDIWLNQAAVPSSGAPGNQHQTVGTLAAGQSKTLTFNLSALPGGAPWTFRAFVDSGNQTTESNDANNQTTVSYGVNPVQPPDFIVTSVNISPTDVKPGATFTAYVTVKNQGLGSGDGGWLDVWANKSTSANCGDSGDAYQQVGVLAAGVSKTLTLSLTAGPAGLNTLLTFVDSTCQAVESNDANNQFSHTYAPAVQVWNLEVTPDNGVTVTAQNWSDLRREFRRAANFLYDATDGQVRFGTITFNSSAWFTDVKLKNNGGAYSDPADLFDWNGYIVLDISSGWMSGYGVIVHELGHYKFGLGDEYTSTGGVQPSVDPTVKRYCGETTGRSHSLMEMQYYEGWSPLVTARGASEFCTHSGPNSSHHPVDSAGNTSANVQESRHGKSCWESIKDWNSLIAMPTGDPLPGPCSKSTNDNEPLGDTEGVAPFVTITGP